MPNIYETVILDMVTPYRKSLISSCNVNCGVLFAAGERDQSEQAVDDRALAPSRIERTLLERFKESRMVALPESLRKILQSQFE